VWALAAEEAAIPTTDANWLAAAAAHDLERVLPFWADDATILSPGEPPSSARKRSANTFPGRFATPDFRSLGGLKKLHCPSRATWLTPPEPTGFSLTTRDGKPVTQENRGVVIWKKTARWFLEVHPGHDESGRVVKRKITAQSR